MSKPHIVTKPEPIASLTWFANASLVDVRGPRLKAASAVERDKKKREKISEWSASSRARLKRLLARLECDKLGKAHIITLTYPQHFPAPEQFRVYKNHLRVFCQALGRLYPRCAGVWKLEFQERGAAHFHIIALGLPVELLKEVRAWCSQRWYEIAHNGDKHEGRAGCQVDPVISKGGVMNYMGKYISKNDQTRPGDFTGRYWGVFASHNLPLAAEQRLNLTPQQIVRVRRWARKKIEHDVNRSRWNAFLNADDPQRRAQARFIGGRLDWERLKQVKHSGARGLKYMLKVRRFNDEGSPPFREECWATISTSVSIFTTMNEMGFIKYPRKWKARRNDRVQVICQNADTFIEAIKRGVERGVV